MRLQLSKLSKETVSLILQELKATIKPYVSTDRDGATVIDSQGTEVKEFHRKDYGGIQKAIKVARDYLNENWEELSHPSKKAEAAQAQFFTERGDIEVWLNEMGIKEYFIDEETLVVDVAGDVNISGKDLEALPVQFGRVAGDFDCSHNKLNQLIGAPKYVGDFDCSHNQLFNFLFGPKEANTYKCHDNRIVSFEGLPKSVEELHCEHNRIQSLKGLPIISGGILVADCSIALDDIKAKSGAKDVTLIPKQS